MNYIKLINLTLIFFLFNCNLASSQILFETNFDSVPDWYSKEELDGASGTSNTDVPSGFHIYLTGHRTLDWNTTPIFQINSDNKRGTSGKCLTVNYEQINAFVAGRLGVVFPESDDIYLSWWMKYPDGFKWFTANPFNFFNKLFRVVSNVSLADVTANTMLDMYKTPANRSGSDDWDGIANNWPWGNWTTPSIKSSYNNYAIKNYTLASGISASDTSLTVNETITNTLSKGGIKIGSEYIWYESINASTKTFSNLNRGYQSTAASHDSWASMEQVDGGIWALNSDKVGGKQASIFFSMNSASAENFYPGLSFSIIDPEGSTGDLSDILYQWDNNSVWNWDKGVSVHSIGKTVTEQQLWNCNSAFPDYCTSSNYQGNGTWHHYEARMKMNSFTGSTPNQDAVIEWWVDGVKQSEITNIAIRKTPQTKWSGLFFPENMQNPICTADGYNPGTDDQTCLQAYGVQQVHYDDLVISTTRTGPSYVIGGKTLRLSPGQARKASGTGRLQ